MTTAIMTLGARSLFGRARVVMLLAGGVLLLGLTLLVRQAGADETALLDTFALGLVVPLVALVATTTLVTSEVDDGSIIYLLTKPVTRTGIVLSKGVVVLAAVLLAAVLPTVLAGLLAGVGTRAAFGFGAGALVAGCAYTGIFLTLATLLKRSITGCLIYWLIWDVTVTGLISSARWLSAGSWGLGAASWLGGLELEEAVPGWYAVLATAAALAVGVVIAGRRLARMTLGSE